MRPPAIANDDSAWSTIETTCSVVGDIFIGQFVRVNYMTPAEFRRMALALPSAEERAHMGHPDFRVGGKIFATLGYPDNSFGTIMLSPQDQDLLIRDHPKAFVPVAGAWGRAGSTSVLLRV